MPPILDQIEKEYEEALQKYLLHREEEALYEVSEIGKTLVVSRLGPDILLDIHSKALNKQVSGKDPILVSRLVVNANEVLLSGIMAFAMNYYIYLDVLNAQKEELEKIRDHLEDIVKERTHLLTRKTNELVIAKERAEESDKLKSVFLATMSHELRTPLNSIIGFTDIILLGLSGQINDEQKKQLNYVLISAKHLLSIIQDILDISSIESGHSKITISSFDMHKAIQAEVNMVTPIAEKKGLDLLVEVMPHELMIQSDLKFVEQILINLLGNAIKFTEKGEIKVECYVNDDQVITRIIDTGIGIKPEYMDNLFKPFIQLENELSRRYGGTGLGLSICKKLVEMLGGKIWVQSEFGKGSVYTFILPLKWTEHKDENTHNRH